MEKWSIRAATRGKDARKSKRDEGVRGRGSREWLKSRIDQLIPWGELKFRLPTLRRYTLQMAYLRGTRAHICTRDAPALSSLVPRAESNITFSPINFIATNVHD